MITIAMSTVIGAPRERVWEAMLGLMAGPDGEPGYEKLGDPPPHGPGAIKRVDLFGLRMREETVILEPPRRRAYRMISGLPVDAYDASFSLEAVGDETGLEWTGRVRSSDAAAAEEFAAKCRGVLEAAVGIIAQRAEAARGDA